MRACSYKLKPHTPPDEIAALPFIGAARAMQISDLATKGTTIELEQHRRGFSVCLPPPIAPLLRSAWLVLLILDLKCLMHPVAIDCISFLLLAEAQGFQ